MQKEGGKMPEKAWDSVFDIYVKKLISIMVERFSCFVVISI